MTKGLGKQVAVIMRRQRDAERQSAVSDSPGAYEQVTRQMVDDLRREIERVEQKVNGILVATFGAVILEIYRTLTR
jgi:hypothetical protein